MKHKEGSFGAGCYLSHNTSSISETHLPQGIHPNNLSVQSFNIFKIYVKMNPLLVVIHVVLKHPQKH